MISALCVFSDTQTFLNDRVSQKECTKIAKTRKELVWTRQENEIYVDFLKKHRQSFKNEKIRRKGKVFIKLAQFVENRTAEQCRSHHQRMMISHKTVTKIIKYLEINIEIEKEMNRTEFNKEEFDKQSIIASSIETKHVILGETFLEKQEKESEDMTQSGLWNLINMEFWFEK